jgi:glycosyltransferase involved in cell wall biosynthesis
MGIFRYLLRIRNVTGFMRSIAARGRFDVIHAQHPSAGAAALLARAVTPELRGTPIVTTGHGTGLPEADADGFVSLRQTLRVANSRLLLPLDRTAFTRADAVISVSEFQRKELADLYHVPLDRISVIYNGVDRTRYRPDVTPADDLPIPAETTPLILFVGRLVPKKGVQYLIEAFTQILSRFPRAHCLIVGGTPAYNTYGEVLKALTRERGVADHFSWIEDGVPEVRLPSYYAAADVCVFPSENYESIPTVIFEAMAVGVPVVTTNRWGSPEALGVDHPGLVPEGDPDALARAVIAIAGDERVKQSVREAQFARIGRFDLEQTASQHEELYRDLSRR